MCSSTCRFGGGDGVRPNKAPPWPTSPDSLTLLRGSETSWGTPQAVQKRDSFNLGAPQVEHGNDTTERISDDSSKEAGAIKLACDDSLLFLILRSTNPKVLVLSPPVGLFECYQNDSAI